MLQRARLGTLLLDLLTEREERTDVVTASLSTDRRIHVPPLKRSAADRGRKTPSCACCRWCNGSFLRPVNSRSPETWDQLWKEQTKDVERLVASVADSLKGTELQVETVVKEGDARSQIIDEASDWRADLIVVGSHGHTGLMKLLIGSVAGSIVSHAPCSVEVVRQQGR